MPAKSKAQQRLFGMVDAYKKGDLKHASKKIKDIADEMDSSEVKKFAKTKTHNLPETVDENIVRINESQLRQIVKGYVHDILAESWKNYAMAATIGAASLFGGPNKANATNMSQTDSTHVVMHQETKLDIAQAKKLFRQAYKDRNANPNIWKKNKNAYCAQLPNGKYSIVGLVAASHGENPWNAIVKKYCPQENNEIQFTLDDNDCIIN